VGILGFKARIVKAAFFGIYSLMIRISKRSPMNLKKKIFYFHGLLFANLDHKDVNTVAIDKRIEKIRSGDEAPLKEIYQSYRSEFLAWISKFGALDGSEANEVYHLTMVAFFENVKKGKLVTLDSSLKTYIFGIGKNKLKEYKRLYAENAISLSSIPVDIAEPSNMEVDIEQKEAQQRINIGLAKLGEPCKSILAGFYLDGMSMEDLANKFNYKSAKVAKNLKYKCLQRLKKFMTSLLIQRNNGK